ncbi:hypothetical protein TNCV_4437511 [Trichonephila clavipes]|nr:hypothetical protein TNCV_4437511 [Trichonephila clavipes]
MGLDKMLQFIMGHTHNVIMIPIFVLFQEGMGMFQVFDNVLVGKGLQAVQARTNFHLFVIKGTGEKKCGKAPIASGNASIQWKRDSHSWVWQSS